MLTYQFEDGYQNNYEKYSCKVENSQESSTAETQKGNLYFHSLLCNPQLLQNPADSTQSFSQDLFGNKIIKKLQKRGDFISVDVIEKKQTRVYNVMENYQFKNIELHHDLWNSYQSWGFMFASRHEAEMAKISEENFKQYQEWINKMKGKLAIGWFLPYCERGLKLRNITLTTGVLNLLNYKPEQFAIDLVNLGSHTFDVCNGSIYKASFLTILNTVRKFNEMRIYGGFTKEQILRQSESLVINQIKGKGNRKVTVETKVYMLSENILCHQIVRVLDQKQAKDHERILNRQNALYKAEQSSYNSLSNVIKMPKVIDPSNNIQVCGYIEIKHEGRSRRKVDEDYKRI